MLISPVAVCVWVSVSSSATGVAMRLLVVNARRFMAFSMVGPWGGL
jgi:hypothetical protein